MKKLKRTDTVRLVNEENGSANEYAMVEHIYPDGRIWIANLNMPFCGTISKILPADTKEIVKVSKIT